MPFLSREFLKFKSMKNFMLFSLCLCAVAVHAMHPLRERLVLLNSIDVMRSVYKTYTPNEKKLVWEDKLDQVIAVNMWNETQMSMLLELKVKVATASFDENWSGIGSFKSNLEVWYASALNQFTRVQLYNMFAVPHDFINTDAPIGAGSNKDCECNKGSAISCVFTLAGDCGKLQCVEDSFGCGFAWMWPCNGLCPAGEVNGEDPRIGQ